MGMLPVFCRRCCDRAIGDRKSTRLNSSHQIISYAVFCLKKKNNNDRTPVYDELTGQELYPEQPLRHFNEVDDCVGVDALMTNEVCNELKRSLDTMRHNLR